MPVLLQQHPEAILETGFDTITRPPPSDQVMAAWRADSTSQPGVTRTGLLHVLIVDDNRDAADSWSKLVRIWGHGASVAYDGTAALAMASDELPDVLFIDIAMPKMDGFQLAQHFRRQSRFAHTLLVAITGWADDAHRRLWADAFDYYLIKPVDPSALEQLLRERSRLVRPRIVGEEADVEDLLCGENRPSPALRRVAACPAGQSTTAPHLF